MSRKVNCSLSTATLRTCLSVLYKGDADEKLKLCFNAYDLDGNGVIDRKELFSIIKGCRHSGQFPVQLTDNLIEDMVDKIFDENDMDGDGTLRSTLRSSEGRSTRNRYLSKPFGE